MKLLTVILILSLQLLSACQAPECHFLEDNIREANAGCFIVKNQKVLFVEGKSGKLSLPGGTSQFGEAPQCTAERETWEETNLIVIAGRKIDTFENGFQLYTCAISSQQTSNEYRPVWNLEIKAIHWLSLEDFKDKTWRFPDQVDLYKAQLISNE